MLQSETTFHPHPSPSPNLIWPAFRVMYLFQSWFEFVFPKKCISPFTPSILFQCCHPILLQLLFCIYVGPAPTPYTPFHPLWMYLIDWRATRTPFLSPQARNRRRQGGALLICQFWKQKPRRIKHKRSLKIRENILGNLCLFSVANFYYKTIELW